QALEDELSAIDRRRPVGVGRDRQNAPLAEQTASRAVGQKRDAAELRSADVRDAVVLRQTLVEEREVRPQQIEDAPVLTYYRGEKEFRFRRHGAAQPFVEVGEESIVRTLHR